MANGISNTGQRIRRITAQVVEADANGLHQGARVIPVADYEFDTGEPVSTGEGSANGFTLDGRRIQTVELTEGEGRYVEKYDWASGELASGSIAPLQLIDPGFILGTSNVDAGFGGMTGHAYSLNLVSNGRLCYPPGCNLGASGQTPSYHLANTARLDGKAPVWGIISETMANGGTSAEFEDVIDTYYALLSGARRRLFVFRQIKHANEDNATLIEACNTAAQAKAAASDGRIVYIDHTLDKTTGGDNTHLDQGDNDLVAAEAWAVMAEHWVTGDAYGLADDSLLLSSLTGTGGSLTGGATGTLSNGFTLNGDAAATFDGTTCEIVFQDGGLHSLSVPFTADLADGEWYDTYWELTISATGPVKVYLLPGDGGDNQIGLAPFTAGAFPATLVNGTIVWRPMMVEQQAGASSGSVVLYVQPDTGFEATVSFDKVPVKALRQAVAFAFTSTNSASLQEGQALSKALTANCPASFAIVGGADAGDMDISGGNLRFTGGAVAPAYASPQDSDANNTYVVTIRATRTLDGATVDQTHTTTVTEVSAALGTPWDAARMGFGDGQASFSNDDYTWTLDGPYAGVDFFNARTLASIDTGHFHIEQGGSGYILLGAGPGGGVGNDGYGYYPGAFSASNGAPATISHDGGTTNLPNSTGATRIALDIARASGDTFTVYVRFDTWSAWEGPFSWTVAGPVHLYNLGNGSGSNTVYSSEADFIIPQRAGSGQIDAP